MAGDETFDVSIAEVLESGCYFCSVTLSGDILL